ncbi:MAG: carbohydrate kinase [Crocinitomicaceae bacterium]
MKIVAFGEVLWDIIEGVPHLGGAPLNFAAHSVQCGMGAAILSAYGRDELGERVFREIEDLNVDTRLLQPSEYDTGTVDVLLEDGIPTYVINENVAYDFIDVSQLNWSVLKEYDCFYFGTLAQRSPESRTCLRQILKTISFETVFLDVNLRQAYYDFSTLDFSIAHCSILKLNDEELTEISTLLFKEQLGERAFSEKLSERYKNIETIIITKGEKGASLFHGKVWFNAESAPIKVGDTIGAGDALSAAFCSQLLQGVNVEAALTFANKIAGYVASQRGAIPTYKPESFL